MISILLGLPAGNAVRAVLIPPTGTQRWRLLRRADADFTGYDDAGAVVVADVTDVAEPSALDTAVTNSLTYYYQAYYYNGTAWTGSAIKSVTPEATYSGVGPDAQTVVRERLAAGLKVEVARGALKHKRGRIEVLTAPPQFDQTEFPVVTVHLESQGQAERFLGEQSAPDAFDEALWEVPEGWESRVRLQITAWALNPDERIALRRAVERVLVANLPVFEHAGLSLIEFEQSDMEEFERYGAPVYFTHFQFSCIVPTVVAGEVAAISAVEATGYITGEV